MQKNNSKRDAGYSGLFSGASSSALESHRLLTSRQGTTTINSCTTGADVLTRMCRRRNGSGAVVVSTGRESLDAVQCKKNDSDSDQKQ